MKRQRRSVPASLVAVSFVVASFGVSADASSSEVRASFLLPASSDSAAIVVAEALVDAGIADASAHLGSVPFVEAMLSSSEVIEWSQKTGVTSVEPNGVVRVAVDQEIQAPSNNNWDTAGNWGLDRVDQVSPTLNGRYSYGRTGAGVDLYIIDTGIRLNHTEFAGRVAAGYYYPDPDPGHGLTSTEDGCGHGTHVAGIAAGTTFGVAKSANIIPVRVFPGGSPTLCNGGTTVGALIDGINWVIDNHLDGTPAVANMSLGLPGYSDILNEAVERLIADGVAVVVAAGNKGTNITGGSTDNGDVSSPTPACTSKAITVGAASGAYAGSFLASDVESDFSNFGSSCVDIFAPGENIKSAWPFVSVDPRTPDVGSGDISTTAWGLLSGTSMATPFVTGAVAQLLEITPSLLPKDVGDQLLAKGRRNQLTLVNGTTTLGNQSPNLFLYTCTIVCTPGAPTGVVATRGNAQAGITWTAPIDDGGNTILSYTATASPDGAACLVNAPATSCTIPGLTNGKSYRVSVTASNTVGIGSPSSEVSIVPATVPGTPVAPTATSGDQSAVVTWVKPETGGAEISSYTMTASPGGATCTTSTLSCTVPGLENGTAYTFKVRAANELGEGLYSPGSSAVIPSASWVYIPGLILASPGNKSVSITWSAAALTSGVPTGYIVKNSAGTVVCTTTALTCRVSGLANGSSQGFTVEATSVTTNSPALSTPKVVVGGLVQKGSAMKVKSVVPLSRFASSYSKGKVTWTRVSGTCRVSGKNLYAPTKKGICTLRVSVSKASPFPAQRLTIRLSII